MSAVDQIKSQTKTLSLAGDALDLHTLHQIGCRQVELTVTDDENLVERMQAGCDLVDRATREGWSVYGVTTGFGGMADVPVPYEMSVASQNNLLAFLATGAGDPIAKDTYGQRWPYGPTFCYKGTRVCDWNWLTA